MVCTYTYGYVILFKGKHVIKSDNFFLNKVDNEAKFKGYNFYEKNFSCLSLQN